MSNFDTYSGVITANAQSVLADCQNNSGVYVYLTGTHAGISIAFEGTADGGASWQTISAYPLHTQGGTATTAVLSTNSFTHWYAMVGAAKQFRVRSTAFTSGSLSVNMTAVNDADPVLSPPQSVTTPAALQDTTTNPTAGGSAAYDFYFNGTQWDRMRNNTTNTVVDTSAARTTTGNGATGINYNHDGAYVLVNVSAVSGTTPTMTVRVQGTVDGTNWFDLDATNASTPSITATGQYYIRMYPGYVNAVGTANVALPRSWRLAWTIGGTTPSFTFSTAVSYVL